MEECSHFHYGPLEKLRPHIYWKGYIQVRTGMYIVYILSNIGYS